MALAKPGHCYFSINRPLKVSNLELGHFDVLVMMGQNVAAAHGFVLELKPHSVVCIPLADAEAMVRYYGEGFIDDRERPDTPEAEAVRCALRAARQRCNAVLSHPVVFRNRELELQAGDLLEHTEKSAWEILRILMNNRPVLVKAA